MTLEDVIQRRRLIDIDLFPKYDLIYSGVCLKANRHFWFIVNFNKRKSKFDGYSVFRNSDINSYAVWEKKAIKIKHDNLDSFTEKFSTGKLTTFYSCLKKLTGNRLVAFFIEDIKSYYVGAIQSLNQEKIVFKLMDKNGEWTRRRTFKISDIIYFSFQTEYETDLEENKK